MSPIYVGKQYQARHQGEYVFQYVCRHCKLETEVAVKAKGWGGANSPFFLNNTGADSMARERAFNASVRNARETSKLLACPRCHKRDVRKVFWFVAGAMIKISLVSIPLILFGTYFMDSREFSIYGWVFAIVGVVLGISLYFTLVHPRWAGARHRSIFLYEDDNTFK